jgi:hypothetical protein
MPPYMSGLGYVGLLLDIVILLNIIGKQQLVKITLSCDNIYNMQKPNYEF